MPTLYINSLSKFSRSSFAKKEITVHDLKRDRGKLGIQLIINLLSFLWF